MADDDNIAGRGAVYLLIDNAEEVPARGLTPKAPATASAPVASRAESNLQASNTGADVPSRDDDGDGGDDDGPPRKRNQYGLPEGCPVIPLGVLGEMAFYLDDLRQLRAIEAGKHGKLPLAFLFGRKQHLLFDYWPRHNKDGDVTGWHADKAAMALTVAASQQGVWDPFKKVRGAGAWLGDDAALVLHCGDQILIGDEWHEPGALGDHVYPASSPTLRPAAIAAGTGIDGPAEKVLALLRTWNWKRKEIDPRLLLGWIAAAMIGGALRWRPVVWSTGGPGTGKSTLQNDMIAAMFDGALKSVDDATAASVRDAARYSTLPIAIDEAEPDQDNRRIDGMIRLARSAASGSITMRSSSDNTVKDFIVRNCFMFSSVLVPGLLPADRSRIAILELGDLKNEAPPKLEPRAMRALGAMVLRRLIDQWHRWPQAIEAYGAAMVACGHSGRSVDVFGTLLAAADLVASDGLVDADTAREWADKLGAADAQEGMEHQRDEESCLTHFSTTVVPFDGMGERRTIAQWATMWCNTQGHDLDHANAERVLGNCGVRIVSADGKEPVGKEPVFILVANNHQGVSRIFQNTRWAARSGTEGVWKQALRRLIDTRATVNLVRIGGVPCRGTLIPAAFVVDAEHEPAGGRQFNYE